MELYVDGCKRTCAPGPTGTVDDLLEPIRKDNAPRKRAILGLTCDGIDVVGNSLNSVLSKPVSDYERIDVQTGRPERLVDRALRETLAILQTAEQQRAETVALFGQGKTGEAIILLGTCLGLWHEINETITKSLGMLGVTPDALPDDVEDLIDSLHPVRQKLEEIKSAVKAQDYVSLSDILEYEFAQVGQRWHDVIWALLNHVAKPAPQPAPA